MAAQSNMPALTASMNNINLNALAQDAFQHPGNIPDILYEATILEQLNAKQIQIEQFVNQMRINNEEITKALAVLTAYADEGPMRARNATALYTTPLQGPNGYLPGPITTRDELHLATGADLDALNTYLGGVQNYVVDGLVSTRRQALATYLGVVA